MLESLTAMDMDRTSRRDPSITENSDRDGVDFPRATDHASRGSMAARNVANNNGGDDTVHESGAPNIPLLESPPRPKRSPTARGSHLSPRPSKAPKTSHSAEESADVVFPETLGFNCPVAEDTPVLSPKPSELERIFSTPHEEGKDEM